jgi:hypothetical protein
MNINIQCSIGEVIDKITILDIKCDEIKEQVRVEDCKRERDSLLNNISHIYNNTLEYYRMVLKKINKRIWDDQEVIRTIEDDNKYGQISRKVIADNDARFRIKKIINDHFNSELKEQKSYIKKTCIVISHLGLGDSINISPAVRYLSMYYDKLIVPVKEKYMKNMLLIYSDNPFIDCVSIHENNEKQDINNIVSTHKDATIFSSGCHYLKHRNSVENYNIPEGFYLDFGLNYNEIYKSREWFYCKDLTDNYILEKLKNYNIIFIHKETSSGKVNCIVDKVKNKMIDDCTILIDACENHYSKDNLKYELAQYFVNKPLAYLPSIIKECNEIYLTDSSIFCMTVQLPLKASVKECYVRCNIEQAINIDNRFSYYKI